MALEKTVKANSPESWVSAVYEIISDSESRYLDLDPCDEKEAAYRQNDYDDVKTAMAWICESLDIDIKTL